MKNAFNYGVIFIVSMLCFWPDGLAQSPDTDSYFEYVKARVFSDPYDNLPQYEVSRELFDIDGENVLLKHAIRTLSSNEDFITLDTEHKLLQANGICFSGTWQMNHDSPYTGLYSANVEIPVIVRASVSLSGTKQDDKRAFGVAIKLFPIKNTAPTQNVFLMHSLGGTKTDHVLSLPMTNEPDMGSIPPLGKIFTALRLERDLERADEQFSGANANARFRPVSHLAGVDMDDKDMVAPYWLRLVIAPETTLVDKLDFRDELNLDHYTNTRFSWFIQAADNNAQGIEKAVWQNIGWLTVNDSITSSTCDKQLHFAHPSIQSTVVGE